MSFEFVEGCPGIARSYYIYREKDRSSFHWEIGGVTVWNGNVGTSDGPGQGIIERCCKPPSEGVCGGKPTLAEAKKEAGDREAVLATAGKQAGTLG